ncbi:RNA polymerase sigma factor [Amycolatopsis japonica]
MMQSRGGRAAGNDDQDADVSLDDVDAPPITANDERELAEFEAEKDELRRAAESLERRRYDQQLYAALSAEGFDGHGWRRFADELARYGHAVLVAWQRTGAIFAQCQLKGRPLGAVPATWTEQDRIDLASDVVVSAINLFRQKAKAGQGWTFSGGASLRTYFIGACVLAYPTIYRAWKARRDNEISHHALGFPSDLEGVGKPVHQTFANPSDAAARHDEIARGLDGLLDERTRVAVMASALGYSNEEIAGLLTELLPQDEQSSEVSVGTVKQILHRHRRRLAKGEPA